VSTYSRDTIDDAVPDPGVVRIEAIVVGEDVPTDQNSVAVVPSFNL
jgi:hypothetical protein